MTISKIIDNMNKKSSIILISIGAINVIHGLMHLIQFVQSILLFSFSVTHEENWLHRLMENPIFGLIMGMVGIVTLVTGIKDYKHHNKCDHKH